MFSAHPTTPVFSCKRHDALAWRGDGDLLEQRILTRDGDVHDDAESVGDVDDDALDDDGDLALPLPVLPHSGHLATLGQPEQTLPMPPALAQKVQEM